MKKLFILIVICAIVTSCAPSGEQTKSSEDLDLFLDSVEADNLVEGPIASSASWIASNFIGYDSQKISADYGKRYTLKALETSREAASFNSLETSSSNRRKLELLKSSFVMPPPFNESLAGELSEITTKLEAMYGNGKHCYEDGTCYDLEGFEEILDNSRDPDELLKAWSGWHEIGKPMKPMYMSCLLYTSPSPRDLSTSRMPSSA